MNTPTPLPKAAQTWRLLKTALCALLLWGSASAWADTAWRPPTFIMLDDAALAATAERLRSGDTTLQAPHRALLRRADRALETKPRSVTHKPKPAPSGDPHDYVSRGPYWWPNPNTPDGLPYIRRDGQRNPEAAEGALDSQRMQDMINDTLHLALAWRFSGDKRYAVKGAEMIRAWFIDPATRMNPHLRYAQGIPGIVDGRGIGLIDTRDMWGVIDASVLLARAGVLGADDQAALRRWFAEYVRWMMDSDTGREEAAAYNNHGMFYDAQVASLLVYIGEPVAARRIVLAARTLRLAGQIDRQGRLPFELDRTRPFHYTGFTLQAATQLARQSQHVSRLADTWPEDDPRCQHGQWRCPVDLWRGSTEGRSLAAALNVLAQAIIDPASLAPPTAVEPKPPMASAVQALLLAHHVIGDGRFDSAIAALRAAQPDSVYWLLWPPRTDLPTRPTRPAARAANTSRPPDE